MTWAEITPVVAAVAAVVGVVVAAVGTTAAVLFGVSRMMAGYETRNDAAHEKLSSRIDKANDTLQAVSGKVDRLVGRQEERDLASQRTAAP